MGWRVNPEDAVIARIDELDIDALVDESLAERPVDDYSVNRYDKCALCKGDWHGLPAENGCPGAHARGYQKREWQAMRHRWRSVPPGGGTEDFYERVRRLHARAAAEHYERELLNSLTFVGQVYGEAERELSPEEWSEVYGVPVGQLGIDPPQPRYYSGVEWRTQAQRPCADCQRALEWRAAYTFRGTSPLCHDCYDSRVRRDRNDQLMREILAAIPREGVSRDELRSPQFDISQGTLRGLRTSGT